MLRRTVVLFALLLVVVGCSESTSQTQTVEQVPTSPPVATSQPESEPTSVPTVAPTVEPTPEPEPIYVTGRGRVATDVVKNPFFIGVLTISHTGDGYFGITAYQGEERELLVNEVGAYTGKKWLVAGDYIFDVDANGSWEIVIRELGTQESVAEDGFSGNGDDVSGLFMPPGTKAWEISHTGDGYFGIMAVCRGGNHLIVNEVGVFSGSGVVMFPEGPCFFQVSTNGQFSITPR